MGVHSEETRLLPKNTSLLPEPKLKSYNGGIIDSSGYGAFTGFSEDATGSPDDLKEKVPPSQRRKIIIVGAGICGIQQASVLLRNGETKLEDLVIFDALNDFGGVWQKNKYPGCACDVPAMVYTTSYYINTGKQPGWREFCHVADIERLHPLFCEP